MPSISVDVSFVMVQIPVCEAYVIPLLVPVVLLSDNTGRMVALLGNEKSPVKLPEVVFALAGTLNVMKAVLVFVTAISVADKLIVLKTPFAPVCAVVVAVLLCANDVLPAKLEELLNTIEDLPLPSELELCAPAAAAASLFLQDVPIANNAIAIIIGKEINFFMFFF